MNRRDDFVEFAFNAGYLEYKKTVLGLLFTSVFVYIIPSYDWYAPPDTMLK